MPEEDQTLPPEVTLEEFCARRSSTDKRVELIGAFHADEIRQQHFKDAESEYVSRLEAFATKPV